MPPNPEHEHLRADEKRFGESALRLKRKMDLYLKTKQETREREAITEREKKLGVCYGLESLVTYMNNWSSQEKIRKIPGSTQWVDGVRLWEFVDGQARGFPVLSALSSQVGALFREEVNKYYVDGLKEGRKEVVGGKDQLRDLKEGTVEGLVQNSKRREGCWVMVNKGRAVLNELGVRDVLGPWSSASDALTYAHEVLGKYERKEKVGWKRDS